MIRDKLESVRSKLIYVIAAGHSLIRVGGLMRIVDKITNILGHFRNLGYKPIYPSDSTKRKVSDALDSAYRELHNIIITTDDEKIKELNIDEIKEVLKKTYSDLSKKGRKFQNVP